jgi:hemerythrin-like domain-containing protein
MAMSREMDRLRAEHAALMALARIILAMVGDPARPALRDTLVRHLKCEDWALYPRLRASGDPELVRVTRAFELEMGDLADDFTAYDDKWTAARVAADWAGFRRETMTVLARLARRVEREDRELYPLADKLYSAAAPVIAPFRGGSTVSS